MLQDTNIVIDESQEARAVVEDVPTLSGTAVQTAKRHKPSSVISVSSSLNEAKRQVEKMQESFSTSAAIETAVPVVYSATILVIL